MTAAGGLGAAAVAGIAAAPSYGWFLTAWLAAGVATADWFYPPAFAALTAWYGPARVRALTILTLAAGFASTIFAALTEALADHLGWRGTYESEAGPDFGKDTIAYCRIGEPSAHTWFVLHELLGQPNVKNYDGSWTEYGSLVGVPIELGDAR